jgi:hypothetical protein
MNFRRIINIFLLITGVLIPAILLSETRIVDFHAYRNNNYAMLEWATEREANLSKFVIQRSTDNMNWTKIGDVTPEMGDSSVRREYRFIDRSIFKLTIGNFYYRLILVSQDGQSTIYDVVVSISGSSGIKHTWGSIKAMFR